MSDLIGGVSILWNVALTLDEEDLKEDFEEDPREYDILIHAYEEGLPIKVTWKRVGWREFTIREVCFENCKIYVSTPPVDFDLMVRLTRERELLRVLWRKFGIVYKIGGYEALDRKEIEEFIGQFIEKEVRR
jgi:hypothetical protein